MDIDKWIFDIQKIMTLDTLSEEDKRKKRLICYDHLCIHDWNDKMGCFLNNMILDSAPCMNLDSSLKSEESVLIYNEFYNLNIKYTKPVFRKYFYFITVTGKDRIIDSDDNITKMLDYGRCQFNNDNWTRYHKVYWNIETGKYKDNPNLHIHALVVFDKSNKNFKRDFVNGFNKLFNNSDYKELKFPMKETEIFNDKYLYLKNDSKSVLHKNYRDLGIFERLEH